MTDEITIRALDAGDAEALSRFAAAMPEHDLLFLSRDIREPKVVAAWLRAQESGHIASMVAVSGGEIVATIAALADRFSWSPHVWDVRLLVAPEARGKGLGRRMLLAMIELSTALGAGKLTARMTPDQTGAITLFEESGFRAEALLKDHVRAPDGTLHDLAVLSLDPAHESARREVFGE